MNMEIEIYSIFIRINACIFLWGMQSDNADSRFAVLILQTENFRRGCYAIWVCYLEESYPLRYIGIVINMGNQSLIINEDEVSAK